MNFIHTPTLGPRLLVSCLLIALPAAAQDEASSHAAHGEHAGHGHAEHGHAEHAGHGHAEHEDHGHEGQGDHGDDLHAPGMHHDFSDAERWSKIFDSPERDAWQRPAEVMELMTLEAGMSVVDLGAGTGYFLPHLAAAVGPEGRVLGLDIEETMVAHMNERAAEAGLANVEARQIPTDDPRLEDASIDRLMIVNTWHHLDDRPTYAAKIGRALAPGGRLVIVDYTLESEAGPPKEHRLSPERVIAELEAGGLVGEVVAETLPRQYVVIARRP